MPDAAAIESTTGGGRVPPEGIGDANLRRVWDVLNRVTLLESLVELHNGLNNERRPALEDGTRIAFGFDTNALYRIGLNGTLGDNAVDYLRQHDGPILIPGQAIQEIWNNVLAGVEPQAKKLQKAFDQLERDMAAIDQRLGPAGDDAKTALEELAKAHGDWLDPASLAVFDRTVEALLAVATTSYVPRLQFVELARVRNDTKTPPGFRDDDNNHGDFYVWADFLYGLAQVQSGTIGAAVFVTDERKPDWTRNGVPHPLLVAEAVAVAGVPFRLWTVSEFQRHVKGLAT